MPTWSDVETGIPSAIREAAQDPDLSVVWAEQPAGSSWIPAVHVKLRLRRMTRVGHGETVYVDEAGQARPVVRWPRLLSVQVQVETQSQTLAAAALALADEIHAGLRLSEAHAALAAAGLALGSSAPMVLADFTDDAGRRRSAVIWEIELNASTQILGPLAEWMASVEYGATIAREDETTLTLGPTEIDLT